MFVDSASRHPIYETPHPLFGTDDFEINGTHWGLQEGQGVRFATIGGESSGELGVTAFVRGAVNRPADADLSTKQNWQHLHNGWGMAQELLDGNRYYLTNHATRFLYSPLPQSWPFRTFNSNSYAHGLLLAVGLSPQQPGTAPGWDLPIAAQYFGR